MPDSAQSATPARASVDLGTWRGRRVLVTGHTGFKGSWLCLWLQSLGARIYGVSLAAPPSSPSLYELARVQEGMAASVACDVRDGPALARAVVDADAEVVFHLAAQPLVRRSLREPALTYAVNALGTANLLDAVLGAPSVRAVVIVTSDKCYAPRGDGRPHAEGDPLGGEDPYSASKACAELMAAAYRDSFFAGVTSAGIVPAGVMSAGAASGPAGTASHRAHPARVATARAGNVFGGGDFGEDRLLPDLFRAAAAGSLEGIAPDDDHSEWPTRTGAPQRVHAGRQAREPLRLRNPEAVRPWQHVLSPLSGYLLLAQALLRREDAARAWNFGPPEQDSVTVRELVERTVELWPEPIDWHADERDNPRENPALRLDSTLARNELRWEPPLSLERGLRLTVDWFLAYRRGEDVRAATLAQIAALSEPARSERWALA